VRDNTLGWFRSWRYGTLAWAGAAASVAPRADVWHGHDMTGLPAALAAQRRYGGRVVYDSHELYLESGRHATRPAWARRAMGVVERRWARRADAVVTVNDSIANELSRRLRVPLPTVVRNCPPRWLPRETEPPRPDLFRQTLPIPAERDILLYQGGFSAHRGLPQIVSLLHEPGLESAVVVFLGYGTLEGWLSEQAARREHHGRLFVVAAVPPDELAAWTASADVSLMPIEPSTLNHVLSTPNKLWESLAAGAPLVASDLPEMARVVRETGAGELCDPSSVESIATAVRRILSRSPEERLAMRRRARAAALDRYNWETESARLLALYETLMPQRPAPAGGPA
jgi:glycosyltransferase involved in cell wall biosynthesis